MPGKAMYYVNSKGQLVAKDPNLWRKNARTGGGPGVGQASALDITQLTESDAGMQFNADGVNLDPGAGKGLYEWDGLFLRRLSAGGVNATPITCTSGAAIFTPGQVAVLKASSIVRLTAAGAVTVGTATTTPILPAGYDSQRITFVNVGTNAITLTTQGTMAASNIILGAAATTLVLATHQAASFVYDANVGAWVQD